MHLLYDLHANVRHRSNEYYGVNQMKAVVLGAGVIGVTSAYYLAREGFEVEVVERREGPGLETSFANGGQISANHCEPWAAPGVLWQGIKWLGRVDAPLLYRLRLDPVLWAWTIRFLANSTEQRFWGNVANILRLALFSRSAFKELRSEINIEYDLLQLGILNIYRNQKDFDEALSHARIVRELGCERQILNRKKCIELEPALQNSTDNLVGGTWCPHDESGDAYKFTREIEKKCVKMGVTFRYGINVNGLNTDMWKVKSVISEVGGSTKEIKGDVFVVALGSHTPLLARDMGIKLPIYPVKGYSLTMPITNSLAAPNVSITDDAHKMVFSRLGSRLRAAGTAEFNGYDNHIEKRRAQMTLDVATSIFPGACDETKAEFWTGLRPATPDGVPIIGRGRQENLLLNTGHGTLGWTMAAGSGRIIASLARGLHPEIDISNIGWERFS